MLTFAPERDQVAVSVTNDNEGAEIIVDFMLVGFPLRGTLAGSRLQSCAASSLPSVSVSTGSTTTESDANGVFVFPSLAPGQHVLSSSSTSLSNVTVTQLWGGADVGPVFQLNRATVRGSVKADNSAEGVNVFLVADADDLIGCERAENLSGLAGRRHIIILIPKTLNDVVACRGVGGFGQDCLCCGLRRIRCLLVRFASMRRLQATGALRETLCGVLDVGQVRRCAEPVRI